MSSFALSFFHSLVPLLSSSLHPSPLSRSGGGAIRWKSLAEPPPPPSEIIDSRPLFLCLFLHHSNDSLMTSLIVIWTQTLTHCRIEEGGGGRHQPMLSFIGLLRKVNINGLQEQDKEEKQKKFEEDRVV